MRRTLGWARQLDVGRQLGTGSIRLERGPHYAQATVRPDGSLLCEVVSNLSLQGEAMLLPMGERALVGMGWHPPSSGPAGLAEGASLGYWTLAPAGARSWSVISSLEKALRVAYRARPGQITFSCSAELAEEIQRRHERLQVALARYRRARQAASRPPSGPHPCG